MKNSPRKTSRWAKGWNHSRIIECMKNGGWHAYSFGYRSTTMRKGDKEVHVTWANHIDKVWPKDMWQQFLDENGLTLGSTGDGVALVAIVERQS